MTATPSGPGVVAPPVGPGGFPAAVVPDATVRPGRPRSVGFRGGPVASAGVPSCYSGIGAASHAGRLVIGARRPAS